MVSVITKHFCVLDDIEHDYLKSETLSSNAVVLKAWSVDCHWFLIVS